MLRLRLATLTIGWGACAQIMGAQGTGTRTTSTIGEGAGSVASAGQRVAQDSLRQMQVGSVLALPLLPRPSSKIGRASCRERV